MSTDKQKLKPTANVLAKFRCSAGVQVIGIVVANGMVSPIQHGILKGKALNDEN